MTIEQLEGSYWGEVPKNASNLMKKVYSLRKVEINHLDENDLRILIGQGVGLKHILPLALEKLSENPLLEALYYRGDLLKSVLFVTHAYWRSNPEIYSRILEIVDSVDFSMLNESFDIEANIREAVKQFKLFRK